MGYLFLIPSLILFLVFVAYPVLNTLKTSFYSLRVQNIATGGKWVGLANYKKVLSDGNMWQSLRFTVFFTLISVVLETIIGMVCALIMNREFRGKSIVCGSILVPWCIPTIVSGLMWSYMFAESYGIINQILEMLGLPPASWITGRGTPFWSVIIADVWKTTPYMGLLMLSGLKMVPLEYYEAASIDGAGKIKQFFYITIPSIRQVLLVAIMFRTISSFRIYDLIKVLTNGGPGTATTSLTMYTMQQYFSFGNYGYGSTLAVITFVVSLGIAFLFYDGMSVGYQDI